MKLDRRGAFFLGWISSAVISQIVASLDLAPADSTILIATWVIGASIAISWIVVWAIFVR